MIKRAFCLCALLFSLFILLVSCSTTTVTVTPTLIPEGSVLNYSSEWNLNKALPKGEVTYWQITVTANIMNIGDEGTFYINAEVTPSEVVNGSNIKKIKVLMDRKEEKTFTFDFWVQGAVDYQYLVWCTNY